MPLPIDGTALERRALEWGIRVDPTRETFGNDLECSYELIVNLKTAQDIGVAIPPGLLTRTDRVIQ